MKRRIDVLLKTGFVLKWLSITLPLIVIVGWLTDNMPLKRLLIGADAMNPTTAVLLFLLALLLIKRQSKKTWSRYVLAVVILISLYRLLQTPAALPFSIDHVLFGNPWGDAQDGINPMAPMSAILFIIIAAANWFGLFAWNTARELLQIIAFTLVLFMITGYGFKIPEFQSSIKLFPAIHTCIICLALVLAETFSRPTKGIVGLLVVDLEGARIGRYLIAFTVVLPMSIAYLRMLAQWHHLISTEMGVGIVMSGYIFIFTISLFVTVVSLNNRDRQRRSDLHKIGELNEEMRLVNMKQAELIEELATSNEEIQASNEAIHAANDELMATNEKLEEAVHLIRVQDEIIIRQKEEALKRSQEYLEIIFSNTEEEILLTDAEGKLIMFNSALENFIESATGKKPVVGMFVWDMTMPERRANAKRLFSKALTGEAVTEEAPMVVNGESVVHLLKYEPVWVKDQIKYITIISVNITERKIAEEQLKDRVEQLQKTNYELDRFVYSVSHDLRAPLSSILGLVNVAEMENKEVPYLDLIRGRIKTLDNFIKSILDYSRNSRTEVQHEIIDFESLIESARESFKTLSGYSTLLIDVQIQREAPFYSDPIRVATILNNLLSNAIRFQDNQKPHSTLLMKIRVTPDHANIIVKDNGIGISSEHQSKVFNMFYRATDRATGSGIGLYLVKETVAKLHGTVKLTSELGCYSEFEIMLPNQLS